MTRDKVRFNEKLDHLQARRPFQYNLVSGALIAALFVLFLQLHWVYAVLYVLSWAALRWYLWGESRILRRQYDGRIARVAEEQAAKRRGR